MAWALWRSNARVLSVSTWTSVHAAKPSPDKSVRGVTLRSSSYVVVMACGLGVLLGLCGGEQAYTTCTEAWGVSLRVSGRINEPE